MLSPVKIWRNQKHTALRLGKVGKVISWSHIRVPPDGFSQQAPYVVALVRLINNDCICAQVVDIKKPIKTGSKVITILRRTIDVSQDGVISYGIKVKPI